MLFWQMYINFRNSHLLSILKTFEGQNLPLDRFLSNYFKENKAVGSHDRKYIAETVYTVVRWKGLLDFFCKGGISWEKRVATLENFHPESYLNDVSIPQEHRVSFPKRYFDFLCSELGEEKAVSFCLASNYPAPTTIRTNTIKITRDALLQRLQKTERVSAGNLSPPAIHFAKRVNFLVLPEFKEGLFEVQDEASQLAALYADVRPGYQILDYCAGSGGKSLAIAPGTEGKGQIYLHDIRKHVLLEAKKRLQRAGIQNAQIVFSEELESKNLSGKMDLVFVDAPCSGSGTLRRNPDTKWKFDPKDLERTVELQRDIFKKALTFVKPKGYIVYATCSVFPTENEKQTEYFLKNFPVVQIKAPFSSITTKEGPDGFYSIVLQKI